LFDRAPQRTAASQPAAAPAVGVLQIAKEPVIAAVSFIGRIRRAAVSPGNVVGPETGSLALLVGQDPMYVTFQVSQRALLDLDREARRDAERRWRVRPGQPVQGVPAAPRPTRAG
jgi:membrane fusion protein (multidrug efflux system)